MATIWLTSSLPVFRNLRTNVSFALSAKAVQAIRSTPESCSAPCRAKVHSFVEEGGSFWAKG